MIKEIFINLNLSKPRWSNVYIFDRRAHNKLSLYLLQEPACCGLEYYKVNVEIEEPGAGVKTQLY